MEYEVTTSGAVPEEFNVTWAKMEISNILETKISVNATVKSPNGTLLSSIMNLNLEEGKVGAWFIIPAGLDPGDCFFDEAINNEVEIEGEEKINYAGAPRTITNATTSERLKRWDKTTGIFVECIDIFDDYSINATAIKTNMWENQLLGLDQTTFQTLTIAGFATIITVGTLMYGIRKRKKKQITKSERNKSQNQIEV